MPLTWEGGWVWYCHIKYAGLWCRGRAETVFPVIFDIGIVKRQFPRRQSSCCFFCFVFGGLTDTQKQQLRANCYEQIHLFNGIHNDCHSLPRAKVTRQRAKSSLATACSLLHKSGEFTLSFVTGLGRECAISRRNQTLTWACYRKPLSLSFFLEASK